MNENDMNLLRALTLAAIAALIAGCTQIPQQGSASNGLPQLRKTAQRFERHRSWMGNDAKSEDLLYVSNGNAEVTVYEYWRHKLLGVLTDFSQPKGVCVDKNQNVYITDYTGQQIVEYAHGGSKPIAKFDDAPDTPFSCSIDPISGNLAVANYDGGSQTGNIAIWSNGNRTTYSDSKVGAFQYCAYDNRGTLLATNGQVKYPYTLSFAWLPENGNKLIDVNLPGPDPGFKWGYLTGLQWDGQYFVLEDSTRLFRESLIHGQGYYVGYTSVGASDWYPLGPFGFYTPIGGSRATQVIGGMTYEGGGSYEVAFWKYPEGGSSPITTIKHGLDEPYGIAVSLKQ